MLSFAEAAVAVTFRHVLTSVCLDRKPSATGPHGVRNPAVSDFWATRILATSACAT